MQIYFSSVCPIIAMTGPALAPSIETVPVAPAPVVPVLAPVALAPVVVVIAPLTPSQAYNWLIICKFCAITCNIGP